MVILKTKTQIMAGVPSKPNRKKMEVPIHKSADEIRTFSANFHSKRNKQKIDGNKPPNEGKPYETTNKAHNVDLVTLKASRKHLHKENQRLRQENEDIVNKFNELETLSIRKITKLKEKITATNSLNEVLNKESNYLKGKNQELLVSIDDLQYRLEVAKTCKNCEEYKASLEKLCKENNSLKTGKQEQEEDLNMLKTVVYRLNCQMERYQEKLRKSNSKFSQMNLQSVSSFENVENENHDPVFLSEIHQDHSHTPISWGKVNIHTLGPLLDAYQDSITEKDKIIQNYEAELSNFTGQLKNIVNENEKLHKALTEDKSCSGVLKQEIEDIGKELNEMRSQNDVLIKKCAIKQDKLEEVVKFYESKMEQVKRDYAVVHEQYCKSRSEVTALKENNRALVESRDSFQNERDKYIPISLHTTSVNECKKWYEELKSQYEQEREKLKHNIESQTKLISDLKSSKSVLETKTKQLEKHIKKIETKYLELEHLYNELQTSRSACRKQLHKAMSFAKDLVAEQETLLKALNQRQQENKAVKKIGSEIATRMDTLRNQLKDVQKGAWQELSTVEKRIEDQSQAMEAMKEEHDSEIKRLQDIIKEQQDTNLLLKEHHGSLPKPHYLLFRDKHT